MKTYLWKSISFMFVALFITCTQDDGVVSEVEETHTRAEISESQLYKPSTLGLLKTYIEKVKFADKKSGTQYSLKPYEFEGDTVMYVANYENGWDLLSTDEHTPIVLVSSETGSYNEDELPDAIKTYIASTAEEVAAFKKEGNADLKRHEDWEMLYKPVTKANTRSGIEDYLGTGYWMLVSTTPVSYSTDSIDHLVQTHWHQTTPYNRFAPYYTSGGYTLHCNAGCAPVAVGQLLKFYADNDGTLWSIPMPPANENLFESLYNSVTNKYLFTNFGYGMNALEPSGANRPRTAYFLGYLGEIMNTVYTSSESTTTKENILNALDSFFVAKNFVMENMNFSKVISILSSGYPVLSTVTSGSNGSGGHALLIDKYVKDSTRYALIYAWVGTDIYGEPMNTYDEWGNVTSWVYSKTEYQTNSYYKISMNWGEGTSVSYDDLKFSVFDTDWFAYPDHYQYNKKIYHNNY
ncbi:MAG: C10 family peptidase [Bacteroidaceae bacterium]|nr:C10 family peptidase [Bacteroidaceae bacterium]